jgi:hypothetical protein
MQASCRGEPSGSADIILLETSVLLSMVAVLAAGIVIGLRFKAPALLAATAVLLVGSFAWNGLGLPGHVTVARFVILTFVLAFAYMAGLFLSLGWKRNGG